jgi:hypothetical protein
LEIYSEYQLPAAQKPAYDEMVGKYPDGTIAVLDGNAAAATQYIVPLRFWWDKAGVGLPSAALEGVDLEIHMRFRTAAQMIVSDASQTSLQNTVDFDSAKFWIDFAFVSDEERAELVAAPQTYLITQIMRTTSDSINLTSTAGDTNFGLQCKYQKIHYHFFRQIFIILTSFFFLIIVNLPATDLIFLLQDETRTNGNVQNNDWFNFGLGDGAAATDFFTSAVLKINNVNREEARGPLYFRNYRSQKTHTASPNNWMYEFPFSVSIKSRDTKSQQLPIILSPFQFKFFFFLLTNFFFIIRDRKLTSYTQKHFNLQVRFFTFFSLISYIEY